VLNPPIVPADTSAEAWKVLCTAMRDLTPIQRIARWESFNRQLWNAQPEAIRRANPTLSDLDVHIECIRRNHGDELATVARAMLSGDKS
jgi:hypothetical protein